VFRTSECQPACKRDGFGFVWLYDGFCPSKEMAIKGRERGPKVFSLGKCRDIWVLESYPVSFFSTAFDFLAGLFLGRQIVLF